MIKTPDPSEDSIGCFKEILCIQGRARRAEAEHFKKPNTLNPDLVK